MYQLLNFANNIYNSHTICPENSLTDSCYDCISSHFYTTDGNEKYDCEKGLAHYILDYGPCYASSTYHFLNKSKIIEETEKKELKILSIGCGFSPDYYAFKKYISDNNLEITIDYTGIELHSEWNIFHNSEITPDKKIMNLDVLSSRIPDFASYDIIFIDKFFSSLSNPSGRNKWIKLLKYYISHFLKEDGIIVFKDVNHESRGRDLFDTQISPLFKEASHYKFKIPGAYGFYYQDIDRCDNIFIDYPENMSINPKNDVVKEIVFVYKNRIQEAS